MINLEGHGRPDRFMEGSKGDIYTDLDTGKKYECTGPLRYITTDFAERPRYYNWKEVHPSKYAGGGAGVSSWNDLTDKPFYDESVDLGPTITWDGNTEGLPMVSLNEDEVYHQFYTRAYLVSEILPSVKHSQSVTVQMTILLNGNVGEYTTELTTTDDMKAASAVFPEDNRVRVVVTYEDNVELDGIVFPKKGVWFIDDYCPSHQGFAGCTTAITLSEGRFVESCVKTLDMKYLPVPFGKEPTEVVLLEEQTITTVDELDNGTGYAVQLTNGFFAGAEIGSPIKVKIDGVEYDCILESVNMMGSQEMHHVGNPKYLGGPDNNLPFIIGDVIAGGECLGSMFVADSAKDYTVEVVGTIRKTKTIPAEYLPADIWTLVVTYDDNTNVLSHTYDEVMEALTNKQTVVLMCIDSSGYIQQFRCVGFDNLADGVLFTTIKPYVYQDGFGEITVSYNSIKMVIALILPDSSIYFNEGRINGGPVMEE